MIPFGKDLIGSLLGAGADVLKATAERFPLLAAALREQSPADLAAGRVRTPEAIAREALARGRGEASGIEAWDFALHDGYATFSGTVRPVGGGRKIKGEGEVELVGYEATRERARITLRVRKGLTPTRAKLLPQLVPWIARAQLAFQLLDASLLEPVGALPEAARLEGDRLTVDLDAIPGVREVLRFEVGGVQVVDLFELTEGRIVAGAIEVAFRPRPEGLKKLIGSSPRLALELMGKVKKGFFG